MINIKKLLKKAQLEYKKGNVVNWDDVKSDFGIQKTTSKKILKNLKDAYK